MRIPHRFIPVLGSALIACGGDLTLPDDTSPAALRVVSGDGQEGTVRSRLDPLVVKLTDAKARPVEGQRVVFQFTSDVPDGEVTPEAMTDDSGQASADVRLGASAGDIQVEARLATTESLKTTFELTAVENKKKDKPGKGGGPGKD